MKYRREILIYEIPLTVGWCLGFFIITKNISKFWLTSTMKDFWKL